MNARCGAQPDKIANIQGLENGITAPAVLGSSSQQAEDKKMVARGWNTKLRVACHYVQLSLAGMCLKLFLLEAFFLPDCTCSLRSAAIRNSKNQGSENALTVEQLVQFCNSSTHKADHGALMRYACNADKYPQLAAAVRAGGLRMKEALAKLIIARKEAVEAGKDPRMCGPEVEAEVTKEVSRSQDINFLGEFWYEADILKELDFDKAATQKLVDQRQNLGLGKGYIVCPNKNIKKYWWATKQETKVNSSVAHPVLFRGATMLL